MLGSDGSDVKGICIYSAFACDEHGEVYHAAPVERFRLAGVQPRRLQASCE